MAKAPRSIPALADVARRAGVGAATVSRVINGGHNVSERTMANVSAVIQQLGYIPSHAARSLKGARSKTIGLIVPSVADPFFAGAAAAIQEVSARHGSLVLLASSENDPRKEREQIVTLIQRRVDGLILAPSDAADPTIFQHSGFPTICFDRPIKGSGLATVLSDNYVGAKRATEYLVERGYRRILCLGGYPKLFTSQRRLRGHREVIRKAGLPYLAESAVHSHGATQAAIIAHLKGPNPIDAIFSTKNTTTMYAYKVLRELGVRIPQTVALLGFDDFELADALEPPISVIRQPVAQIGSRAAELLFHQMEKGDESHSIITLPVDLVVRGSCGGPEIDSTAQ